MLLPPSMSSGPSPASIVSLPLLPRTLSASGDPVITSLPLPPLSVPWPLTVSSPGPPSRLPVTVDGIVPQLERDEYRMQSLLQAVVASEAFRMK